ncbi:hypothetical protein [Longibacter salinarum]|nr:hypothetical protein [Longibacter salinarum]
MRYYRDESYPEGVRNYAYYPDNFQYQSLSHYSRTNIAINNSRR